MLTYDADLEALDTKWKRVVSVAEWRAAETKAQARPETLTDDDLAVLRAFAGVEHTKQATERRTKALAPPEPPSEASPSTKQTERRR